MSPKGSELHHLNILKMFMLKLKHSELCGRDGEAGKHLSTPMKLRSAVANDAPNIVQLLATWQRWIVRLGSNLASEQVISVSL